GIDHIARLEWQDWRTSRNCNGFARQQMRQPKTINIASMVLVWSFIAGAAAGCSSVSSLTDVRQPMENSTALYVSGACFYSNEFGTERSIGGGVLHWCGPEPR